MSIAIICKYDISSESSFKHFQFLDPSFGAPPPGRVRHPYDQKIWSMVKDSYMEQIDAEPINFKQLHQKTLAGSSMVKWS